MSLIGKIAYWNPSRRFLLLTPLGKTRNHDIFAHEIHFDLACIEPHLGMSVQFEVAPDANGKLEAVDIRLSTPVAGVNGLKAEATGGAEPAPTVPITAAPASFPETR